MNLKQIQTQVEALEALPRQAAFVYLRLHNLSDELDRAWFTDDGQHSFVIQALYAELFERLFVIKHNRPFPQRDE